MSTQYKERIARAEARVAALVARFNGQIKYFPMLLDHPDWSDDQCEAYARTWDATAREQYKADPEKWNNGIPYARNIWRA